MSFNLFLLAFVIVTAATLGALAFRFLMQWTAKFDVTVDPVSAVKNRLREIEAALVKLERQQRSNPAESRQHADEYSALLVERRKLDYRLKNLSASEIVAA